MVKLKWLQRVGCFFCFVFFFFGGGGVEFGNLVEDVDGFLDLLVVFLCVSMIFDQKTY